MAKKKKAKQPYSEKQKISLIVGSIGLVALLITELFIFDGERPFTRWAYGYSGGNVVSKLEINYVGIVGLALAVGGAVGFFV